MPKRIKRDDVWEAAGRTFKTEEDAAAFEYHLKQHGKLVAILVVFGVDNNVAKAAASMALSNMSTFGLSADHFVRQLERVRLALRRSSKDAVNEPALLAAAADWLRQNPDGSFHDFTDHIDND